MADDIHNHKTTWGYFALIEVCYFLGLKYLTGNGGCTQPYYVPVSRK